jgi:hypothetical protein
MTGEHKEYFHEGSNEACPGSAEEFEADFVVIDFVPEEGDEAGPIISSV